MTPDDRADALAAIACPSPIHGSRRAYTDHGCRCPETVEFMRRGWRRRRPTGRRLGTGSRPTGPHIDPIAVERAIAGDHTVRLTVAELTVAVAELTRRGYSARAIAVRLGVSDRTVTRHRAARQQPSTGACGQPNFAADTGGTVQIGRPLESGLSVSPAAADGSDGAEVAA